MQWDVLEAIPWILVLKDIYPNALIAPSDVGTCFLVKEWKSELIRFFKSRSSAPCQLFFPVFLVGSYEIIEIKMSVFVKEYLYSYFLSRNRKLQNN